MLSKDRHRRFLQRVEFIYHLFEVFLMRMLSETKTANVWNAHKEAESLEKFIELLMFLLFLFKIDRWPEKILSKRLPRSWFSGFLFCFDIKSIGFDTEKSRRARWFICWSFTIYYALLTQTFNVNFSSLFAVSASYVPGPIPDSTRSRHAPLYGRLVSEEHLPASHRDVHQVRR